MTYDKELWKIWRLSIFSNGHRFGHSPFYFLFCSGFRMSETLVYLLFFLPTGKLLEWLLMFNPSYTYQVTCITLQSHNCTSIAYQVKPLIGQMFFLFFLVQLVKSRAEIKFTERERKIGTCWKLKNGQKTFEQNQHHHKKKTSVQRAKTAEIWVKKLELIFWIIYCHFSG